MSIFTRRVPAKSEQRSLQVTPWGPWGDTYTSAAGVNVDDRSALQLMTVFGCVSLIADTVATLPIDVYRTTGKRDENISTPKWLDQPNEQNDIVEFLTQTLSSLLLDGNAYWSYVTNANSVPTELYCLNPREVEVKPDDGSRTPVYLIRGKPYTGRLVHIKGFMLGASLKGLSPVEFARQTIGLGLAGQQFAGQFFNHGAAMPGVIKTPPETKKEQAVEIGQAFMEAHAGVQNAWKPGVLFGGAEWETLSVTPQQAEFLQSRKFTATEIAGQMFLLEPSLLGIPVEGTSLTYANLEQRGIHLVQFSLLRWIVRLERAFTKLLPAGQFQKFNVNGLQRADLKTQYEAFQIGLGSKAWLSINEVREKIDLPPAPNGSQVVAPAPVVAPMNGQTPVNGQTPAQENSPSWGDRIFERVVGAK